MVFGVFQTFIKRPMPMLTDFAILTLDLVPTEALFEFIKVYIEGNMPAPLVPWSEIIIKSVNTSMELMTGDYRNAT